MTRITGAEIEGYRLRIRINSDLIGSDDGCSFSRLRLRQRGAFERRRPLRIGDSDDSALLTTIVSGISWVDRPHPDALINGHSVTLANRGRIFFGELIVARWGRRLTMIRFDLGSPFKYVGLAAHVETNGEWVKRREGSRSATRSGTRPHDDEDAVPSRGDQDRYARPSFRAGRAKASRTAARQPVAPVDDAVQCSVFAPSTVPANSAFLIQALAHLASQAAEAARLARQFDELSSPRGTRTLGREQLDTALTFTLRCRHL